MNDRVGVSSRSLQRVLGSQWNCCRTVQDGSVGSSAPVEVRGVFFCVWPNGRRLQSSSRKVTRLQMITAGVCFAEMMRLPAAVRLDRQTETDGGNSLQMRWINFGLDSSVRLLFSFFFSDGGQEPLTFNDPHFAHSQSFVRPSGTQKEQASDFDAKVSQGYLALCLWSSFVTVKRREATIRHHGHLRWPQNYITSLKKQIKISEVHVYLTMHKMIIKKKRENRR